MLNTEVVVLLDVLVDISGVSLPYVHRVDILISMAVKVVVFIEGL